MLQLPRRHVCSSGRTRRFALRPILAAALLLLAQIPGAPAAASTSDQRQLMEHLTTWSVCHGMRLLDPGWTCAQVVEPPPGLAELAAQLHALGPLDLLAYRQAATQTAPGPIARCLIAAQSEVRNLLNARMRGRERPSRGGGWVDAYCDGVVVPDWPDDGSGLELPRACAHAMNAQHELQGAIFGDCLRTLAGARMAEAGVGPALRRPNIVVILTDDQRFDTIDATHSPLPALGLPAMPATFSRLAGEGVTFTQAVVTTPICGPSRGSFFTGRHTYRHGMLANSGPHGVLDFDDSDTFATRLRAAGYRTSFMGKYTNAFDDLWTAGVDAPYVPPGWDDFQVFNHSQSVPQTGFSMIENGVIVSYDTPEQPYTTDVLAAKALAYIDASVQQAPGEPFALWLSVTAPHFPWDPAPRHLGAFDALPLVLRPNAWEEDVSDKPAWVQARPAGTNPLTLLGQRNFRARQLEMQLSVDEMVAALVDRLEARGIGDDTIIVYASDNGHGWGEHRWDSKGCPWEECLRVPMLMRYPRLVPGPRSEAGLVANVDVVPTLLALAGAEMADDLDGFDLGPVLRGLAPAPERDVLFEAYGGTNLTYAGVRADGLKYLLYRDGFEELYDLEADPYELDNAAYVAGYQALRDAMRARLQELWPGFQAVLSQ